ncbi:LPS translocon maturation chaperone LptM [Henriciella aquimarina]|uniref:LPS translocon maturation chaperone LptM n=1 Tax=Henriciella aquimarina TaxID=545261 RepID=UPI000A04E980|nr:lipoprotein [Henriciella aquimarina]
MKRVLKLSIGVSVCAFLAGCGIRGDLERPPPIFSDPPSEEAQTPVDVPVEFALAPERSEDEAYYNELGGEIPKPDPEANVDESGMGEVGPSD